MFMIQVNSSIALPKDSIISIIVMPVWRPSISVQNLRAIIIGIRRFEERKLSVKIRRIFDIFLSKYNKILSWEEWVNGKLNDGENYVIHGHNNYVELKELLAEDVCEKMYTFRVETKQWKSMSDKLFRTEAEAWDYISTNYNVELIPQNQ